MDGARLAAKQGNPISAMYLTDDTCPFGAV